MRQCERCEEVKFGFQFHSEFTGLYTAVYDICKKCVKELGNEAARNFTKKTKSL